MSLKVGKVIWLDYPFEDIVKTKKRPALIIEITTAYFIAIPITSKVKRRGLPCFIEIVLVKPSFVNVCRKHKFPIDTTAEVLKTLEDDFFQTILTRYREFNDTTS